jgi:hypothetical protein
MSKKVSRSRVLDDRLWDEAGRLWTKQPHTWATLRQVDELLDHGHGLVVFGVSRGVEWVPAARIAQRWSEVRTHLEVPGARATGPDGDGLTYRAVVWSRDGEQLVGLQVFC